MWKVRILLVLVLIVLSAKSIYAQTQPSFPACSNPQGDLVASYDNGTHGIVGRTDSYTGSDRVYKFDDGNLIQCFCSDNGDGIQTDWWRVGQIASNLLDQQKVAGWTFVPSGLPWGLDDTSYLARNSEYSCGSSTSNDPGGSSNSSSDTSGDSGIGGGDVLGWASTGNTEFIYSLVLMGLVLTSLGVMLRSYRS